MNKEKFLDIAKVYDLFKRLVNSDNLSLDDRELLFHMMEKLSNSEKFGKKMFSVFNQIKLGIHHANKGKILSDTVINTIHRDWEFNKVDSFGELSLEGSWCLCRRGEIVLRDLTDQEVGKIHIDINHAYSLMN
jgi:hypothetical protein